MKLFNYRIPWYLVQNYIGNIRAAYTKDFSSKDITKQQIAVATYFIDKLALRAGNDKVQSNICRCTYLLFVH